MKKLFFILFIFSLASSCQKDFEEINTNPLTVNDIDPTFLFSTSLHYACGNVIQTEGPILAYASCYVQHFASTTFNWTGDKYLYNGFQNDVWFLESYKNDVRNIVDVLAKTEGNAEHTNLHAAALIWKAVIFHRITDLYGDVPYFEAGRGFLESNFAPQYDPQELIYLDLLEQLDRANDLFDPSAEFIGAADFIFNGDIEKWRRFGNTLMLRLALRLTKADPATAEMWAKTAISNGLMESIDDSVLMPRNTADQLFQNSWGVVFVADDNARLSKAFVDWMKSKNDPRLDVLSYVATGTDHLGLPPGLDDNNLADSTGNGDLESYSRLNPAFVQLNTPVIFMGYAEAELMLAEAAARGWHTGNADVHYRAGIGAAIAQLESMAPGSGVPAELITPYLEGLPPLPVNLEAALQSIHEQYWAATFFNELEAYANWRRTGYPVLQPSRYPNTVTGGTIPRRFRYPQKEYSVNPTNVNAAVGRQGTDAITTRVWWDN